MFLNPPGIQIHTPRGSSLAAVVCDFCLSLVTANIVLQLAATLSFAKDNVGPGKVSTGLSHNKTILFRTESKTYPLYLALAPQFHEIFSRIIDRPFIAGAVLQTMLLLII